MAVNLIAKIEPKNDAFTGLVDAKQVIGDGGVNVLPDTTVSESSVTQHTSAIDHGTLSGLADNDHTQYFNQVTDPLVASGQNLSLGIDASQFSITEAGLLHITSAGITDHGLLSGLADNDHVQYLNQAASPLVVSGQSVSLAFDPTQFEVNGGGQLHATSSGGVTDHGLLSGLADDDHTHYLLANGSRELSGTWNMGTQTVTHSGLAQLKSVQTVVAATVAPSGTTATVDWDNGNSQVLTLASASGNLTLTLTNPRAGATYVLKIIQHATVAKTITWDPVPKWPAGLALVVSAGASAVDLVSLFFDGTYYYANYGQGYN